MKKDFSVWDEKYRPKTIDDLIAPASLINYLRQCKEDGAIGNLLLAGQQGTGKTTTAKVIVRELGASKNYLLLNCSKKTSIQNIRNEVETFATTSSAAAFDEDSSHFNICILDEADRFSAEALDALKGFLEETKDICRFIFTTNHISRLTPPLLSRLKGGTFKFGESKEDKEELQKAMLKRVFNILKKENVEFNKKVVWDLIVDSFPDFRGVILTLQQAKKTYGVIDERILDFLDDTILNNLVDSLKARKINDVRTIAKGMDSGNFYGSFYSQVDTLLKNECIPDVINSLGEYAYRDGISVNKEVNLVCCLIELMKLSKWK